MKGFVPTPEAIVDMMVGKLFKGLPPTSDSLLLDPGCGAGAFIEGILRWSQRSGTTGPRIVGVDSDPSLLSIARARTSGNDRVTLVEADFLKGMNQRFHYIIGNPPYVSITGLSESERSQYRERFSTALGRFDLYTLFFEQAIKLLQPSGRLVFITPEKFTYVQSASRLRRELVDFGVSEIVLMPESTFGDLVTYPAITTLGQAEEAHGTCLTLRDGTVRVARLPRDGSSWLPSFTDAQQHDSTYRLADAFVRISCGVATGADQVYVLPDASLPTELRPFAYPTISGRELEWGKPLATKRSMLVPYTRAGDLLPESALSVLGEYLRSEERHQRLLARTCVSRKPWYSFHENPPLTDILRPKILCKDITAQPRFFPDLTGVILPRHSVYYLVPVDSDRLTELCEYLNSEPVGRFLQAHCQRAANGFIRLQSHVLKRVPLPSSLTATSQLAYA